MPLPLPRKVLVIGVSVVGAVVVLAAIAIPFLFLPLYGQRPADVLPADATIALFENVEADELARWMKWYPEIAELEPTPGRQTVAILRRERIRGAIVLRDEPIPEPEGGFWAGPFQISVTNSMLYDLLLDEHHLSASDLYRQAAEHSSRKEAFRFVTIPTHAPETFTDALLQAWLLAGRTHAGITDQSGGTLLALVGGAPQPVRDSLAGIPKVQSTVLCAADGAEAWGRLQAQLPADTQVLIAGIADGIVERHVGARASLRYDLLPLLETEGCLTVLPQTATGGMRLALRATAADAQSASGAVARLESAYRASRTAVREEYRVFDGTDFASRMIRMDDAVITADTEDLGRGWTLKRWSEPSTNRVLVIAVREATVVVGTDEQAVRSLLPDPMAAPRTAQVLPGTLWATGMADSFLSERLQRSAYAPLFPLAPFLWSVERKATADFVTLQAMPADLTSEALDSTP